MRKVLQKVYLSPESKEKIERLAEQKNISQSSIARHWIEDYLDILVFSEDNEREVKNNDEKN